MNRCVFQSLQLVSTEIAEATEGERKNLMDDHLPHRKMGEVELADAMIRLLDLGGRYGWSYVTDEEVNEEVFKMIDNVDSIGGKHLILNTVICGVGLTIVEDDMSLDLPYTAALDAIKHVSDGQGYDIFAAMSEKLEYNKTCTDHTRENRAAIDGKKF